MLFSLEALQAATGDCLILHYGDAAAPHFVVIDGGPAGVYDGSLKPRLGQLRRQFAADGNLKLEMVMVSHIDDDHIHGLLDWMEEIGDGAAVPSTIATLWYNSFDAVLEQSAQPVRAQMAALAGDVSRGIPLERGGLSPLTTRVLAASVAQGRRLRAYAEARGILLNGGFQNGLVLAPAGPITRPGGLTLRVIGPDRRHLADLETSWREDVAAHPDPVVVANFVDRAVPNLSSIVAVAEFQGKRMLLTGDARGDFIRDGLQAAGLLDPGGRARFDVIKMPHHGSDRNMRRDWLEQITADHYVISANGEYGNPDADTIEWICQARGNDPYTIHLTNRDMVDPKTSQNVGELVQAALDANPGARRQVDFRRPNALSVMADVLDPVAY